MEALPSGEIHTGGQRFNDTGGMAAKVRSP